MMQTSLKKTNVAALVVLALVALAACTKSRNNEVADEALAAQLMAISDLNEDGQMKLGSDSAVNSKDALQTKRIASNEKPRFQTGQVSAPSKISGLLEGRTAQGKAGETLALKFILDPHFIFVLKRVDRVDELGLIDRDLVETIQGMNYVKIFKIPVLKIGVLVNQRTDNGERSYKQELRETALEQATHVAVDLRRENVQNVDYSQDKEGQDLRSEIFRGYDLDKKVTTAGEASELLQTDLRFGDPSQKLWLQMGLPSRQNSSIEKPVSPSDVVIRAYQIVKKSSITDKQVLAKINTSGGLANSKEVLACSSEAKAALGAGDDCIMLLAREVAGVSVKAVVAKGADGYSTGTLAFDAVKATERTNLIKVEKNAAVGDIKNLRSFSPIDTLKIADIKGKEFLFRRTFENAASGVSVFSPGASGAMDIVKFDFEDDRLVVRRADAVNADRKALDIDKEELMSIPAVYYNSRGQNGELLDTPRESTRVDSDLVVINWTQNQLPIVNSPLSYLENGSCFQNGMGSQTVSDVDMRLGQGILSFSIEGSYAFRPECISLFNLNDYSIDGPGVQSNFNLRERVSFRVHNKTDDQVVNQDLPFPAQNLLGFGFFTKGRRVADRFGNLGQINNEIAMPVVQDFHGGKTMTYHLGGLPEDPKFRQIFVDTTRQVVADWNEALHRSFKGTELDRSGDYILLKVDGIDATPGHLGDLDRNYIWNFDKNLDSPTLGLSQPAANPRTGYTMANNVLMYSGNLLSYIGHEQKNARILREFDELRTRVTQKYQADFEKGLKSAEKTGGSQVTGGTSTMTTAKGDLATQLLGRLSTVASSRSLPRTPMALANPNALANASKTLGAMASPNDNVVQRRQGLMDAMSADKAYLHQIIAKALAMNGLHDETMLSALSAAEVLKAYGPRLAPDERRALSLQTQRLAMGAEFKKGLLKNPGCILSVEGIPSLANQSMADIPVETMFSNWYAITLSHEMGHSLGLTHNFKGSYDKANFVFGNDGSDKDREYSSVMDYSNPFHENYRKPGPYDVHALRAGYTGLVEVTKNPADDLKIPVKNGLVKISDLANALVPAKADSEGKMVKSLWNLNANMLRKVALKHYDYCTDIHADGGDPTCKRWDSGTTPLEVVQSYIQEYNNIYPLMNTRGSRISLGNRWSYENSVLSSFMAIRSFMDETFYRVIQRNNYSREDIGNFANASFEAYKFFLNVFNTPQILGDVSDEARFIRVDYEKTETDDQGKPVKKTPAMAVIEGKAPEDILMPGFEDSAVSSVRGIEIDKSLAIAMLTSRGLGSYRYAQYGYNFSFADFEKYLLGIPSENSLLLTTLRESLASRMTSRIFLPEGNAISVDAAYAPETTDLMRYYVAMGSTVFLEASTLEDKDNNAALFRVGLTLNGAPPADRPVVTKLDFNTKSTGAPKYWAFDNSLFSAEIIYEAYQKRVVLDNLDALTAPFLSFAVAKDDAGRQAAAKAAIEVLTKVNGDGILVSADAQAAGVTMDKVFGAIASRMQDQSQAIAIKYQELKGQKIEEEAMGDAIGDQFANDHKRLEYEAKSLPIFGVAGNALLKLYKDKKGPEALAQALVVSPDNLKTAYGMILGNLQTLNKVMTQMNPELNR